MATSFDGSLNALTADIQDIANELLDFQPYLSEAAPDIPALVSELYAISACLQELQIEAHHLPNLHDIRRYSDVIRDFIEAASQTLQDLDHFLGKKNRDRLAGVSRRDFYRLIWEDLNDFFIDQSGNTLLNRLGCFKLFLQELNPILAGRRETREFDILYQRIDTLLSLQDNYLDKFRQMKVGPTSPPTKVKSWERKRPGPRRGSPHPIVPPPLASRSRPTPASPTSASGRGRFWEDFQEPIRPFSPPSSSTFTATSSGATAPSASGSEMANHWLPVVFAQSKPITSFKKTETESALFDEHMEHVRAHLHKSHYTELLVLPFESGFELRIYLRERDYKARIYCKHEKGGKQTVSCRPVSSLQIFRKESNLQLCRTDNKKKTHVLWADLRFANYERLILFFCAFLALKRADYSMAGRELKENHFVRGEVHVFDGVIVDDHYQHVLQIYKDKCSDGVRLQASVWKGEMKKAPVWTAFLNYKISSLKWLKRVESNKIHLGDLPRYVYSSDYTPHLGPNGEHEIHFESAKDAGRFAKVIEDLAEGRL